MKIIHILSVIGSSLIYYGSNFPELDFEHEIALLLGCFVLIAVILLVTILPR
jgi:hypothetical protein